MTFHIMSYLRARLEALPEEELAPLQSLIGQDAPSDPISTAPSVFDSLAFDEGTGPSVGSCYEMAKNRKLKEPVETAGRTRYRPRTRAG